MFNTGQYATTYMLDYQAPDLAIGCNLNPGRCWRTKFVRSPGSERNGSMFALKNRLAVVRPAGCLGGGLGGVEHSGSSGEHSGRRRSGTGDAASVGQAGRASAHLAIGLEGRGGVGSRGATARNGAGWPPQRPKAQAERRRRQHGAELRADVAPAGAKAMGGRDGGVENG